MSWSELRCTGPAPGLGAPGLWRAAAPGLAVFDLPPSSSSFDRAAWRAWAAATRGAAAPNWRAPEVEVATRDLIAEVGPYAAMARVHRTTDSAGDRLALRHDALAVGAPLGPARAAWLRALVDDAAGRWRLVRVGLEGGSPVLEVDLTGAPRGDLAALLPIATGALRLVAEWLLPPLQLLLDPNAASAALDRPPPRLRAAERTPS